MNCCKIGLTLLMSISDYRHGNFKLNCTSYEVAAGALLVTVKTFSTELMLDVSLAM